MFTTKDELTIYDSYLIVDKKGALHKISYRCNLIDEINNISHNSYDKILKNNLTNADDIKCIRKIAEILEEENCELYQLTRL